MRSATVRISFLGVLLLCRSLGAQPPKEQPKEQPKVRLTTSLSHTAIWVGDPFEYRITLTHPKDIEIIRDNLKKENLNLDPFTILDLRFESQESESSSSLDIILLLTTKERNNPEPAIPPINLYYATRHRGSLGKGTELETHTLIVPEKKIGFRTTLTSESKDIRDTTQLAGPGALATKMWIPGWILLGLALLQAGQWGLQEYRRRASTLQKRDRKVVEQQALSKLRSIGTGDGQDTPESYSRVSEVMNNTVKEVLEFEAGTLTPEELKAELKRRNVQESLAQQISGILETCETARYAPRNGGGEAGRLQALVQESQKAVSHLVQL